MKAENFCFFLQGFFEMTKADKLTPEQVKMIKEHLQLVFMHDPSVKHETHPPTETGSIDDESKTKTLEDLLKKVGKGRSAGEIILGGPQSHILYC